MNVESQYKRYKANANRRGIGFHLTLPEFERIVVNQPCYYCGTYDDIGVDRKMNNMGYSFSNCVPCCMPDNFQKGKFSEAEYLNQCNRVAEFQKQKKLKWYQERGFIHEPNGDNRGNQAMPNVQ